MPKQKFGDPISQSEARLIRFHISSNLHILLPDGWSAWGKTADSLSDEVEKLSHGEITLTPDQIEMIARRVLPQ